MDFVQQQPSPPPKKKEKKERKKERKEKMKGNECALHIRRIVTVISFPRLFFISRHCGCEDVNITKKKKSNVHYYNLMVQQRRCTCFSNYLFL